MIAVTWTLDGDVAYAHLTDDGDVTWANTPAAQAHLVAALSKPVIVSRARPQDYGGGDVDIDEVVKPGRLDHTLTVVTLLTDATVSGP